MMRHFAIRTVKNGKVKIQGKSFTPSEQHQRYDGELDGLRYVFGLYHNYANGELQFISLWGSEQFYKTGIDQQPPEVIDGTLPWIWWNEVNNQKELNDKS